MQFTCHQCGKAYKHKTSLTNHLKYECGMEAQFYCPHCPTEPSRRAPWSLIYPWSTTRFLAYEHSYFFCSLAPDGRAGTTLLTFLDMQFPCHQCGKAYKHKTSLTKHLKYECGMEAQFQCPRCPYKAKQKASLKSHLFMRHQQIPDL